MTIRQFGVPGVDMVADVFRDMLRAQVHGFPGYVNDPAIGFLTASQRGAGATMSIDVAPGACYIASSSPVHGFNFLSSDAIENRAIGASHATNGRRDLLVARWKDATEFGDAGTGLTLEIIAGTPAAVPVNPALPARCLHIATVVVNPGVTSIVNANILNVAPPAGLIQTAAKASSGGYEYNSVGFTKINFGAEIYDYGGNFTPGAAHSYVCPTPGIYTVKARLAWTYANSPQFVALAPFVSGVEADRNEQTIYTTGTPSVGIHGDWDLRILLPTQTIDVRLFKDGGNPIPLTTGSLSIRRAA